MQVALDFYRSTVGKKIVVAITGIFLFLFVAGHVVGNLKVFGGFDPVTGKHKLDLYGEFLRTFMSGAMGKEGFLWVARIFLLGCLFLHLVTVAQLLAHKGQPQQYAGKAYRASTVAARSMMITGVVVLLFIFLHILHFTTGHIHGQGFVHGEVYGNLYRAFQIWWIAGAYAVAMCCLSLHLYHGTWSLFQTLGLTSPNTDSCLHRTTKVVTVLILIGFISIPLAVFFGFLPEPQPASHAALNLLGGLA